MINCFEFWYEAVRLMIVRGEQGIACNEGLAWVLVEDET